MENINIITIFLTLLFFIVIVVYIQPSKVKPITIQTVPIIATSTQGETQISSFCINRIFGEWEYINKRCGTTDGKQRTTLFADKRSRQITNNKINDSNDCSFNPLANEVILETDTDKGFLNSNNKFEFRPNVFTFKTVQTENNISEVDNSNCKCDGPGTKDSDAYSVWSNWNKECPFPSDTTKPVTDFTISRTRTRTYKPKRKELNGGECYQTEEVYTKEKEDILCPRDCSGGTWGEFGSCISKTGQVCKTPSTETQAIIDGEKTKVWIPSTNGEAINNGKKCIIVFPPVSEPCDIKCDIDCKGHWGPCSASCGSGTKNYIIDTAKQNGGTDCPAPAPCNDRECRNCTEGWTECTNQMGRDVKISTRTDGEPGGKNDCRAAGEREWCDNIQGSNLMFIRYPLTIPAGGFKWDSDKKDWKNIHTDGSDGQWGKASQGWGLEINDNVRGDPQFRYSFDQNGYIRPTFGNTNLCLAKTTAKHDGYIKPTWEENNCLTFGWNGKKIQVKTKDIGHYVVEHNYCLEPHNLNNYTPVVLKPCTAINIEF